VGIRYAIVFIKPTDEKVECQYYLKVIDYYSFIVLYPGGFLYTFLEIKTLFVAACFLLIALIYDYIRRFLIKKKNSPLD
jgi:hypothetical protein